MEPTWNDPLNAEIYLGFQQEHGVYEALNRRLAGLADVSRARRVLDLACGAGATAEALVRLLPARAELVGVDASRALVEIARAAVRDPRCRFVVSSAAAIGDAVSGTFDRVVSNAAFWQFPAMAPVVAAVGALLEPGGLLVFNVPAELVEGEESAIHPFQAALARAVEIGGTGGRFAPGQTRVAPALLADWLSDAGCELIRQERFVYRSRQRELVELMRIPAMLAPLLPTLDAEARERVVDQAASTVDLTQEVEVPWIYFVARRVGRGPSGSVDRSRPSSSPAATTDTSATSAHSTSGPKRS